MQLATRPAAQKPMKLLSVWRLIRHQMNPVAWGALLLWVALMVAMPHALRIAGRQGLLVCLYAAVVFHLLTVVALLWPRWEWVGVTRAFILVAVLGWGMEVLGTATGFPFGSYAYTDSLWPQIADVPLLIPLAWMMMLAPSWAVAEQLDRWGRWSTFAIFSGAAIAAWDLFLDPQMVSWGLWNWAPGGGYFGIPWINYGGWVLTGILLTLAVRPSGLPSAALLLVYTLTWVLESIGLAFYFGLPGPALVGFAVMGLFCILAWWRLAVLQRIHIAYFQRT